MAHHALSRAYLMKGDADLAERHARKASRMDPLNADYYEQLGNSVFMLKRYSEAITELGTAVEIDPERVSAYLTLARTYEQIGDTTRAIAVLEETLHRDRYYTEALYFLARLHLRQHEYDNAIRVLDELIRLEPGNPEALLLRIQAYSTQGSFYYARTLVEEMIREWPDYRPLRYELLYILFSQHQWDEARGLIGKLEKQGEENEEMNIMQQNLEERLMKLEKLQKKILEKIEEEGLERRWQRHIDNAKYTQKWAMERGQSLFPESGFESETITCIRNDADWNINDINDKLLEREFRMDRGYGKFKGKAFRIPHMGNIYMDDLEKYLTTFDEVLCQLGY